MTRTFTGWHMTGILVAFFGVVIAVNIYMAREAISTFGGTVVENSYVASQRFNGWLEEARRQKRLGWSTRLSIDPARHAELAVSVASMPMQGAAISGVARHPLGRAPDVPLHFAQVAPGQFRSQETLPSGRWLIHVLVRHAGRDMRLAGELQ